MSKQKTGPRRRPIVRAEERAKVAELYKQGWYQVDIALELGISQPQVSYDLQVLKKQWLESGIMDINEAKARELSRLDRLEEMALEAWYDSREPKETLTDADDRLGSTLTVKLEQRDGNPAFLSQIHDCIKKRCDILGLNAKPADVNSGANADQFPLPFERMSKDEKKVFLSILDMPKDVGTRVMARFLGLPEPVEEAP